MDYVTIAIRCFTRENDLLRTRTCEEVWSLFIHEYMAVKKLNCIFTYIKKVVKPHIFIKLLTI